MTLNPTVLLACSSPEALNTSYQVAYYTAALVGAAVVLSLVVEWLRGNFAWLAIYAVALVLHPVWWLGYGKLLHGSRAVSGDCGYGSRFFSVAVLLITVSVLLLVLFRPGASRRLFLVILTAGSWIIYLGNLLFWHTDLVRNEIPLAVSTSAFVQELIMAVDFAQSRLIQYAIIVTVICASLYIPWSQLLGRSGAGGSK